MFDPDSSLYERITHLKYYETFKPTDNKRNTKLDKIFNEIKTKGEQGIIGSTEYCDLMEKIIEAILYTRNIWDGRGERDLTYSYIYTLQQHLPIKAVFVLYTILEKGIGSWRDVLGYVNYIDDPSCPFVKPILGLYNNQLEKDWAAYKKNPNSKISLAAKWVPREKKNYTMFSILVKMWCYRDPEYKKIMESATTEYSKDLALNKCKKMYRTMVSTLNKALYPSEKSLEPAQAPAQAQVKTVVKSTTPLWKIVKWAGQHRYPELMNEQWNKRLLQLPTKDYYVPLLDVSEPMYEDGGKPLYKAIIKACQYAYASHFGPNIIVFASKPEWVSIENCTLEQIVARLQQVLFVPYVALNDAFELVQMAAKAANIDERDLKVKLITHQIGIHETTLPYENVFF